MSTEVGWIGAAEEKLQHGVRQERYLTRKAWWTPKLELQQKSTSYMEIQCESKGGSRQFDMYSHNGGW